MKKNLFAMMIVLAGALTISPLSIALENSAREDNLPDVMYVSNQSEKTDSLADNEKVSEQEEKSSDSNSADNSFVKFEKNKSKNLDKVVKKENAIKSQKSNINDSYEVKRVTSESSNKKAVSYEIKNKDFNKKINYIEKSGEEATKKEKMQEKSLNREEALKILEEKNGNLKYDYMGDENTFNVLKEKGQEGYVFIPDVPTDLGMFVNKNTKEVYTFHPSGSLDIY